LAGWTVSVENQTTGQRVTGQTTATGEADFTGLAAGRYKICHSLLGGWRNTQPAQLDETGAACYWITLPERTQATLYFGNTLSTRAAAMTQAHLLDVRELGAPARSAVYLPNVRR
jgi:hypothetical protein